MTKEIFELALEIAKTLNSNCESLGDAEELLALVNQLVELRFSVPQSQS